MRQHNLLTDPIFLFGTERDARGASLPELFDAITRGEAGGLRRLRPYQRHAGHAFLVQLGALAMRQAGARRVADVPAGADFWRNALRALTPDWPDDDPWHLAVWDADEADGGEAVLRPAFLQPPCASVEAFADYRGRAPAPDSIDLLVSARNYDVLQDAGVDAAPEDWCHALVSQQTCGGYSGAGNYGVARMNGGAGSRPAFSLAPAQGGMGAHARRDIDALLTGWPGWRDAGARADDRPALLWLLPWNGTAAETLDWDDVNPLCIEVCRRIRLTADAAGRLTARRASSDKARIRGAELRGLTGDPWTPCNLKEGKSLTLAPGGFTYRRVCAYLTAPEWSRPLLLSPTARELESAAPLSLVARGLVRGRGKTDGYYERVVPLRPRMRDTLLTGDADTPAALDLQRVAGDRVEQIGTVQQFLQGGLTMYMAGGFWERRSPEHAKLIRPWTARFGSEMDARFFECLQDELEVDEADAEARRELRQGWLRNEVIRSAQRTLADAMDALPCASASRYRARSRAEQHFYGRLSGANGFPGLLPRRSREDAAADDDFDDDEVDGGAAVSATATTAATEEEAL